MKKILEKLMFALAFLTMTFSCFEFTCIMWIDKEPSTTSYVVAVVVAISMTICFFVWPILLGLGKSLFASRWIKSAKESGWAAKSIGYMYFTQNWWRFILHGIAAGCILFILYIIGDLIVFGDLPYTIDRLTMSAQFSLFFLVGVGMTMIIRYKYYLSQKYGLPISKN